MHILVTGGSGFIGSHLVAYHLAKGDQVQAIDDLSTGSIKNIAPFLSNPAFQFEQADILTWPHLEKAVQWADRIYHLAAIVGIHRVLSEPLRVMTVNINGCERLLHTISSTKARPKVIIASSSSVYGLSHKPLLNEEDELTINFIAYPILGYALSKITDEALGLAYYRTANLPVTLVRLFNTIGPRQTGRYGMVVPRFIQQALQNEAITIYGDGEQTRSFCDVRDIITALDKLANKPESSGEIINVGHDTPISINRLAELIRSKAKSNSEIKHLSYREAYGEEFTDIKQRRPDLTKLYKLTDFKHQWTLEATIDDLIKNYQPTA